MPIQKNTQNNKKSVYNWALLEKTRKKVWEELISNKNEQKSNNFWY